MMTRYKMETVESGSTGEWYPRLVKSPDGDVMLVKDHESHDQAQRAVIEELRNLCLEAYQVVGSLAGDAGMFEHPATTKILDNLSMAGTGKPLPHRELLPYPASNKIEQQAKEIAELKIIIQACNKDGLTDAVMRAVVENATLWEALQLLYDCQNGCPLPKYEAEWNRAMALTRSIIEESI